MPSIVIAQGGGPTAVINQTLCGAILAARGHDPSVRILGARFGVRGLTAGEAASLTPSPQAPPPPPANTPHSALRSPRAKPPYLSRLVLPPVLAPLCPPPLVP